MRPLAAVLIEVSDSPVGTAERASREIRRGEPEREKQRFSAAADPLGLQKLCNGGPEPGGGFFGSQVFVGYLCETLHLPLTDCSADPRLITCFHGDASSAVDVSERSPGLNRRVMRILFVMVMVSGSPLAHAQGYVRYQI